MKRPILNSRYRKARILTVRIYAIISIATAIVALYIIIFKSPESQKGLLNTIFELTQQLSKSSFVIVIGSTASLVGIGTYLFKFLNENDDVRNRLNKKRLELVESELERLKHNFASKNPDFVSSFEFDFHSKEKIDRYIKETVTSGEIAQLMYSEFDRPIELKALFHVLSEDLGLLNNRLQSEIARLTRTANLNLVLGSLITITAVAILAMEVYRTELSFKELVPLLSHYLPRITIVIFIEIFAFFFLKVYRTNLIDIKYFHNEKTNVEMKIAALKTAIRLDLKSLNDIVLGLSNTERNFILKKDESTIELEKEKIEATGNKNIVDALKEIIKLK